MAVSNDLCIEVAKKLKRYKENAEKTNFELPSSGRTTPLLTVPGDFITSPRHSSSIGGSSRGSNESRIELPLQRHTPLSSFMLPSAPPPTPGDDMILDTESPISPIIMSDYQLPFPSEHDTIHSHRSTSSANPPSKPKVTFSPEVKVAMYRVSKQDSPPVLSLIPSGAISLANEQNTREEFQEEPTHNTMNDVVDDSKILVGFLLLSIVTGNLLGFIFSALSVGFYFRAMYCYKTNQEEKGHYWKHHGLILSIISMVCIIVFIVILLIVAIIVLVLVIKAK